MIWALLAVLGVPIWLIVGALGTVLWSRRQFRMQEDVFPLSIRAPGEDSWPRTVTYGRLIRDILVVNRGPALLRATILPITAVRPIGLTTAPRKIDDATGRSLGIDGHDDIEVAVPPAVGKRLDEFALASSRPPDATRRN